MCIRALSRSGTSFGTSSTATASSSTSPRAGAAPSSALPDATLVVNADDPLIGDLARGRENTIAYGLDDPSHARESLQHAADSKYCRACGTPYEYAAAYVGHLGDYRCPNCHASRGPLAVAARSIDLHGLDGSEFSLETPDGNVRVKLELPGLYNIYNATAAAAIAGAVGAPLAEIAAGLERFTAAFGRFERIAVGDKQLLMLLIKNPAGANEVVRTLLDGSAPRLAVVALNDEIADGRDVSWIWDVDFEPLLDGLDRGRRLGQPRGRAGVAVRLRRARARPDRGRSGSRGGARPRARHSPATADSWSCSRPTRRCSGCAASSPAAGSSPTSGRRRQ